MATRKTTNGALWLVLLLTMAFSVPAQESFTLDELAESAQEWAEENIDPDVLAVLRDTDRQKVDRFLADLERLLRGESVAELAGLRDMAKTVLPLLDSYEETEPYAAWLKSRLDYLDVANEFQRNAPRPEPGKPAPKIQNPPAKQQREAWTRRVAERPMPERARQLVPRLKPVFAKEGVPEALVWVAEVESSFDPRARSPAGAAGLFQLMPATAKRFGLRRSPADQRYNPERSASAAAKYLRVLHGRFKDWRLALAAYNAGEGTVERALKARGARTFDEVAPYLPAETQLYVPKIEATLAKRERLRL